MTPSPAQRESNHSQMWTGDPLPGCWPVGAEFPGSGEGVSVLHLLPASIILSSLWHSATDPFQTPAGAGAGTLQALET